MHNPQLLIVADDVTGAADSAARCVGAGLTATIDLTFAPSLQGEESPAPLRQISSHQSDVLALSTDSRFLSPTAAATRLQTIVKRLQQRKQSTEEIIDQTAPSQQASSQQTSLQQTSLQQWYKKIDSTLRGNIGAELAAMLPLVTPDGQRPHAIICPAFPAQQRTLVDGYLCYDQLPPRTLHLPTMLAQQCALSVVTIPLEVVRAGVVAIRAALVDAQKNRDELIVVDAESVDDLAHLIRATNDQLPHALFCGSAGLVGVLANHLATQKQRQVKDEQLPMLPESRNKGQPMLIVVGSGSGMAHQQLDYLRTQPSVAVIEIDPTASEDAWARRMRRISTTLENDRAEMQRPQDVVLHLPKPPVDAVLEGATARQSAARLAATATEVMQQIRPARVLIVGGDTAVHFLKALEIQQLEVVRELLPGMPLALGSTGTGDRHQIILKAGNHGDRETLVALLQ